MELSQSQKSVNYNKGDIIKYDGWSEGDETPEIFECILYDEPWGVVWYNDNGRKDSIGISYVRLATQDEIELYYFKTH